MAALAVHTILTEVPIILLVTRAAQLRHLDRTRRIAMAGSALQLGMCSEQREMRLLGVVKAP